MKRFLLIAVVGLVGLTACKKDKPVEPQKTRKDYLTQAPWKTKEKNGSSNLDPCELDNIYTFTDTSITFNFGSNLCQGESPVPLIGTWNFYDNETKIAIDIPLQLGQSYKDSVSIIQLDDNIFEFVDKDGDRFVMQH